MKFDFSQPLQQPDTLGQMPQEDLGFWGTAGDIGMGVVRGAAGAAEGVYDLADWVLQDWLPDAEDNFGLGHSQTMAGGLVQGMTQFLVGFVPAMGIASKLGKVTGLAKVAGKSKAAKWGTEFGQAAVAGAAADFTVFDAHEERLSNLLQMYPSLQNPVSDFLAADESDTEMEGRLKNMLEGGVLGFAMEPFVIALKALKAARKARVQGVSPEKAANVAMNQSRQRTLANAMPNLNAEEVAATDAIARSMGFDLADSSFRLEAGGVVGETALRQMPDGTQVETRVLGTFVSKLNEVLKETPQRKQSASQLRGYLKKQGVKDEEMYWSGLDDYLAANPKVDLDEAADAISNIRLEEVVKSKKAYDESPFKDAAEEALSQASRLMDPVNDALRDMDKLGFNTVDEARVALLEYPNNPWEIDDKYKDLIKEWQERMAYLSETAGKRDEPLTRHDKHTLPGGEDYTELVITWKSPKGELHRADYHWKESNVLAWSRFNTRTDANGKKQLFLEEIQSDWHQEGSRGTYDTPTYSVTIRGQEPRVFKTEEARDAFVETLPEDSYPLTLRDPGDTPFGSTLVPDAPFKKTWQDLVFKRMVAYATENGFDSISWTTGAQQAKRWNKMVADVDYLEYESNRNMLIAYKGGIDPLDITNVRPEDLTKYVDKEIADALINSSPRVESWGEVYSLRPEDVGHASIDINAGQGMSKFYDKILVKTANTIGKKFGLKVQTDTSTAGRLVSPTGETQHVLPLNQKIKDSVTQKGQPLFQADATKPRGSVHFEEDGKAVIRFFEASDVSTGVHEIAHVARRRLFDTSVDQAKRVGISDTDIRVAEDWAGATRNEDGSVKWSIQAEEKFARGFEKYLKTGKAPNKELQGLFSKFAGWLRAIYDHVSNNAVDDIKISPEMKEVFDNLVSRGDLDNVKVDMDVDFKGTTHPHASPSDYRMGDASGVTLNKASVTLSQLTPAEKRFFDNEFSTPAGTREMNEAGVYQNKDGSIEFHRSNSGKGFELEGYLNEITDNLGEIPPRLRNGKLFDILESKNEQVLNQSPAKASFSAEEMEIANKTFRKSGKGAVGAKAVTPRVAKEFADANLKEGDEILSFGSGPIDDPMTANTQALEADYNVVHHDFGVNLGKANDPNALDRQYPLVMASNVLNVQATGKMLATTVKQIADASTETAIVNLPASPRKGAFDGLTGKEGADLVEQELRKHFANVERVGGTPSNPVFKATAPKDTALLSQAEKIGKVKRSAKYGVGKQVGNDVYMEKSYIAKLPKKAQAVIKRFEKEHSDFDYKVVKYNENTGDISFIQSRDFDRATEPSIDASIKYTAGKGFGKARKGSTVYHHKWAMVDDSYKGFSTEEAMQRSIQWSQHVDAKGISRKTIGSKQNWENISREIDQAPPTTLYQAAPAPGGRGLNTDRMVNGDKVRAFLNSLPLDLRNRVEESINNVTGIDEDAAVDAARYIATMLDENPEQVISVAKQHVEEGSAWVATQIAIRNWADTLVKDVVEKTNKLTTGSFSDEMLMEAHTLKTQAAELVIAAKEGGTLLGVGLQSQNRIAGFDPRPTPKPLPAGESPKGTSLPESMWKGDTAEAAQVRREYIEAYGGGSYEEGLKRIQKELNEFKLIQEANPGSSAAAMKHMADRARYSDMLVEYWINSILSGPVTHMVNMMSNTINTLWAPLEQAMGHAVTLQGGKAIEDLKMYVHLASSLSDAAAATGAAWKNWGDTLDVMGKVDTANPSGNRALSAKTDTIAGQALDFVGKTLNLPSRFLMSEDAFFKHLNYRAQVKAGLAEQAIKNPEVLKGYSSKSEYIETSFKKMVVDGQHYTYTNVRKRAEAEAYEKFKGEPDMALRMEKMKSHVIDYMAKNWDEEQGVIASKALEYGRGMTYTKALDTPDRAALVRAAGGFNKWVNNFPLLRMFAPFVRTPTNLLAFYLDRSAGAMLDLGRLGKTTVMRNTQKEMEKALTSSGPDAADVFGRLSTGAIFTFGALTAVANGRMTGGGPKDPERRRLMEASGWQPYSIRVGEEWWSYKRFDPFANFFGTVADIMESVNENDSEDDTTTLEAVLGHIIFAASRNIMSKSYLTGVARITNVLAQPERYSESYVESTVSSFVPFSGLASQTIGSAEHHQEIRGILDAVRAKYGLTSETDLEGLGIKTQVETKRNLFGEKMDRPNLVKGLPIHYTEIKDDVVMQEMVRLKRPFGPPKKVMHGINTTEYYNKNGMSFYEKWQENHGRVKLKGRTMRQALKALVRSANYRRLSPDPYEGNESPRAGEIRKLIRKYRQKAWEQTLKEFPEVQRLDRRNTQIKAYRKAGRSIQSLLEY